MTQSIATSITNLQALIGAIDGINQAPAQPRDAIANLPFSIAYPENGFIYKESSGDVRELHTIAVEVHLSAGLLPTAVASATRFLESVIDVITTDANYNLSGGCESMVLSETNGGSSYQFGRLGWGDDPNAHIGFRLLLTIKIRSTA